MATRSSLAVIALLSIVMLGGCSDIKRPLVIGAKDFAEQRIIAHIVAQSLRAQDIPAEVDEIPRDSLDAIGALWAADIDLYVEYTGSALALVGHPPIHDVAESLKIAGEQLAPFGLAWGPLLGFRNDYAVLARPGSAFAVKPARISRLAKLNRTLRIGMTTDFRSRPIDGYEALARHYGLRAKAALVVPSSPAGKDQLYAALLDGEIDIAVGFLTDPEILDFGLVVLADDHDFFPAYASAPLTRAALLERRPELIEALDRLEDIVSTDEMRKMVFQVANRGADPFAVAAAFLDPTLETKLAGAEGRPLGIAIGHLDAPAGQAAEILLALRKTFPRRQIMVERLSDPLAPVLEGNVRYALVSGPEFFALDETGRKELRGYADAVVPVGFDVMHMLVRSGEAPDQWRILARLGVGAADGVSVRTAAFFQAGIGETEMTLVTSDQEEKAAFRAQAEQLRAGDLDGLLVMIEPGHPSIEELLEGGLELAPIEIWKARGNRVAFPFLQPVTIPAATYTGQSKPVASFGSQVVLATARPDPTDAVGVVGPGSAAIGKTLPVGAGTVARIREALEAEVRLDPSLPVARAARRPPPERPPSITQSPLGSFINLAAIVVLVLIIRLYMIRRPGNGTEKSS
jgi:glycine betaine/choline ABC-type transport system substrate-binding protein